MYHDESGERFQQVYNEAIRCQKESRSHRKMIIASVIFLVIVAFTAYRLW